MSRPLHPSTDAAPLPSLFAARHEAVEHWRTHMHDVPHRLPGDAVHRAVPLRALDPLSPAAWREVLPTALHRMSSRRLRGFLAGRLCAETVLERLGLRDTGVGRGPAGEPVWPPGIVGSIAHTEEMAYAVARRTAANEGLGIDSECIVGDEQTLTALRAECCTAAESRRLFGDADEALTATIVFSAKEALYKAIHRRVQRLVEFSEVEISAIDRDRRTACVVPAPSSPLRHVFAPTQVSYRVDDRVVHTCASVAFLR